MDSSNEEDKEALADYLLIEYIRESVYSGRTLQTQRTGTSFIQSTTGISYTFVGVYYLNKSDGAMGLGHTAIMLVTSDNKGILYSFAGDASNQGKIRMGESVPGILSKAVDSSGKVKLVDVAEFMKTGSVEIEKYGRGKEADHYTRYIYMPITNQEGQNIWESKTGK